MSGSIQVSHAAIVSRRELDPKAPGLYLQISTEGPPRWTHDPEAATAFVSMREASRAAARLPSALCAYSMPREVELYVGRELN
jgi:hypothetical protein